MTGFRNNVSHTNGQQAHEKMLNITNRQKNANQNHEISPHTCQNGYHQKEHTERGVRLCPSRPCPLADRCGPVAGEAGAPQEPTRPSGGPFPVPSLSRDYAFCPVNAMDKHLQRLRVPARGERLQQTIWQHRGVSIRIPEGIRILSIFYKEATSAEGRQQKQEIQSCSPWNKNHIHRKIDKMKRQRAMYQMKEQDKTP